MLCFFALPVCYAKRHCLYAAQNRKMIIQFCRRRFNQPNLELFRNRRLRKEGRRAGAAAIKRELASCTGKWLQTSKSAPPWFGIARRGAGFVHCFFAGLLCGQAPFGGFERF